MLVRTIAWRRVPQASNLFLFRPLVKLFFFFFFFANKIAQERDMNKETRFTFYPQSRSNIYMMSIEYIYHSFDTRFEQTIVVTFRACRTDRGLFRVFNEVLEKKKTKTQQQLMGAFGEPLHKQIIFKENKNKWVPPSPTPINHANKFILIIIFKKIYIYSPHWFHTAAWESSSHQATAQEKWQHALPVTSSRWHD